MNLSHLYYFRKLAEVKHYTRAARELYIAQPTLSGAIVKLEEELGVPLFKKTAHSIELTECGRNFYTNVCLSLNYLENGIAQVKEEAAHEYGTLKLGTTFAMQGENWANAAQEFKRQLNSDVVIDIEQGFTNDLISQLKSGKIDIAFAGKIQSDSSLCFQPCWSQELVLVVNKIHPLAKRKSITLEELGSFRLTSYVAGTNPAGEELLELMKTVDLSVDMRYNDEITMCSLVSAEPSRMALICYSFLVKSFDDVAVLRIEDLPTDFHTVYLIYRNEKNRLKVVDRFIDFISGYTFPVLSPEADRA